jgi:L-cystine uptake protein TcyP (sodium:dicarboxylate symporter family)
MTSSVMPSSGLLLSVTSTGASGVAGAAVVAAALELPLELAALSLSSDPQAEATIASTARMSMNRFIIKTYPS